MFEADIDNALSDLEAEFGNRPKLAGFFNFARSMPSSLIYEWRKYTIIPPKNVKRLRSSFNKSEFKIKTYQYFGSTYGAELVEMGITNTEIDRMISEGRRPKHKNGQPLDFTIDHMTSLGLGGLNDVRNFCFLPGKFNHFKDVLERLQIGDNTVPGQRGEVLTILPSKTGNKINRVPYFEGGYQPRVKNAGLKL